MSTTLDVVNECLATMGEAPLNTLTEPHEFKASAQRALSKADEHVQSRGWWYNNEELLLTPDPVTSQIILPGDCLRVEGGIRSMSNLVRASPMPWLVQRGLRLYNVLTGSFVITESVSMNIARRVPFEDLPTAINLYISAETVLKFQSLYDGDSSRRAELVQAWQIARSEALAENTRQLKINLRANNPTLSRIKSVTRSARYNMGR